MEFFQCNIQYSLPHYDHGVNENLITFCQMTIQTNSWSEVMTDFRPSSRKKGGGLKPCKAVATTGHEFANATSIHGISYIFDTNILILERILWLIIVTFFAGLSSYWIVDAYLTWQESPMLTSVSSTGIKQSLC